MSQNIHPTAYIAPNVELGNNSTIGPFAVIESGVVIEEGNFNELQNKEKGYFSKLSKGMKHKK